MIFSHSLESLLKQTALILTISILFLVSAAKAATIVVPSGGDLQAALNAANCGDDVVLQAGATFSGNFALRYKGPCSGTIADYITIRTANLSGIPSAGTRITPANASAMAKLLASSGSPALEAEANAHHYKLVGIEITNVGGNVVTPELVMLGSRSSGGGIPFTQHPHHITFDRCWIHEATNDTTTPDSTVTTAIRGFNLDATDITITESRIAGFRAYQPVSQGVEASNAILFPSSALRVTVQNTFLEAWFCPVFFGGSGGSTPNSATLVNPVFDANTHTGSAVFSSVSNLSVGDLVALKTSNGRTPATNGAHSNEAVQFQVVKVTGVNGNTVSFQSWGAFDGNLAGGNPLLQTPDAPGLAQWNGYLNQDITLQSNQFVENFASTEQVWVSSGGSPTTLPRSTQQNTGNAPKGMIEIKMAKNLLINGNTFEGWEVGFTVTSRNQGNSQTSGGFPWAGVFNVTISNNWWKRMQNWDRIYGYPIGGPQLEDNEYSNVRSGPFTFANNLVESGTGPILASMGAADNVTVVHNTYPGTDVPPGNSMVIGQGAASPNFVFKDNILAHNEYGLNCQSSTPCWPNLVQNHNVILDNRSAAGKSGDGPLNNRYPNDFIAANQAAVRWVDTTNVNYTLASNSPYKGQASDGTDPGVSMTALLAALSGSSPTATPTPTPTPATSPTATPTPTATPSPTPTGTPTPGPSPTPTPDANGDTVWVEDALPVGSEPAGISEGWNWINSGPGSFSGSMSHQSSIVSGVHHHMFSAATNRLTINAGDVLIAYVYLDPLNLPSEVMVQWMTGDWDHRAYWGANNISWGTNGTESKRYMGALPAAGQWVRLEVPASQVGLEGSSISGIAFTLYDGRATWDHSGKATQLSPPPTPTPTPTATPTSTPTPSATPTPTPTATPTPTPTPGSGPAIGSRVKVDVNGVFIRSGPAMSFAVIGTQVTTSRGTVDQACADDSASARLFCHVTFAPGASGWLTADHLVMLSTTTQSPDSVSRAKVLANTIVGGFDWSANAYPGAADNATPTAAAVAANLDQLVVDIQQASELFASETDLFGQTDKIATQLTAALYFTRADLALAGRTGPSASMRAHLERIIGHLSITEDLMHFGSITPETAQLAAAVGARTDLVIGALNSGYGPSANGLVAPASLGSLFGNSAQSPLASETMFATFSAGQSLPYELSGVSVSVGGQSVPVLYVSPTRLNFFVPADLPIGDAEVIVVSQNGYVSAGSIGVMRNVTRVMTLVEDETGMAIGLNDAKQVIADLSVTTSQNFGPDKRTRLTFFATGVSGSVANTDASNDIHLGSMVIPNFAESVVVEAHTQDGHVYNLPVEFAGPQGGIPGLDQINVVLIPALQGAGTVDLTLIVNGQRSNAPTIVVQ